jgi:hypothetical protein
VENFLKRRATRLDAKTNWGKIKEYAPIFSRFPLDFAGRDGFNARARQGNGAAVGNSGDVVKAAKRGRENAF